jgi:hypothetical protein
MWGSPSFMIIFIFDMISGRRKINGCIIPVKRFISNLPDLKWDWEIWQVTIAKI